MRHSLEIQGHAIQGHAIQGRAIRGHAARVAGLSILLAAGSAFGLANEPDRPATPSSGRYTMAQVDGGFLRMDTDTGTVSLCAKKGGSWSCESVADDYKAVQKDADRLAQENAALRRELAELRRDGGVPAKSPDRKLELPSEEEIDKAIGQFEKYLKKFKDLIEKHSGRETPGRI